MMPFFEGYVAGLALIVLVGPVLFVLLGATLERGTASGLAVAAGIFASDILAVSITALGLAEVLVSPGVLPWVAVVGGAMLLGFGARNLLASPPSQDTVPLKSTAGLIGFFTKGFLVNFVNPFVFMVWLGIVAAAGARHGTESGLVWFLAGTVLGILTLDTLKVVFASRIKRLLSPKVLRLVYRGSGTVMCLFGVRLIITGWV